MGLVLPFRRQARIVPITPGRDAAIRALQDPKSSLEVRMHAAALLGKPLTIDAEPVPEAPMAVNAEEMPHVAPAQFIAAPVGLGGIEPPALPGTAVLVLVAASAVLSCALYGAVKLGGEVVHLMLGVQ